MIRKTLTAMTVAGALALGTASATSLGDFDDVAFAASDVDLLDCELDPDAVTLTPALPDVDHTIDGVLATPPVLTLATPTALLSSVDVNLDGLDARCLADAVLSVIVLDVDGKALKIVDVAGSTLSNTGVNVISMVPSPLPVPVDVTQLLDVASVGDIRLVLS